MNTGRHYDVSSDGKRLLLLKDVDTPGAQPGRPEIHVGQHRTEELKAKAKATATAGR